MLQGKYFVDFFLCVDGDDILLDVDVSFVEVLKMCLIMYKLCVDVMILDMDLCLYCGIGDILEDGFLDLCVLQFGWCVYWIFV